MTRLALALACVLAAGCGSPSQRSPLAAEAPSDTSYSYRRPSPDGIGKYYMGREIAQVMGHQGAAWLERPTRQAEERTDLLVRLLDLQPTDVVADIGAGTGYFTFRLAERVPQGRVFAVDIQPEMLAILAERQGRLGLSNVVPILGRVDDPNLPADTLTLSLVVDAYHEFSHPREMLAALHHATKPGGRLVLVEYRANDPAVPIKPLHTMTVAQARREVEALGFDFVEVHRDLPQQHVLVFTKPERPKP